MNKQVAFYQEKFTESRVALLQTLAQTVASGEYTPRQAVERFAKITLLEPRQARNYMYLMDNFNPMWSIKL